jgi:hypothetical protein
MGTLRFPIPLSSGDASVCSTNTPLSSGDASVPTPLSIEADVFSLSIEADVFSLSIIVLT